MMRYKDLYFTAIYSLLLIIPDAPWIDDTIGRMPYGGLLLFNMLVYLSITFLLCYGIVFLRKIHKSVYCFIHTCLHIGLYTFSISNTFLFIFFSLRWDAFTLQLLEETNETESIGFLETYIPTLNCSLLIIGYIAICLIEYLLIKRNGKASFYFPKLALLPLTTFTLYNGYFFTFDDYRVTYDITQKNNTLLMRNMLWKLNLSIQQYADEKEQLEICAESQKHVVIDSCTYKTKTIVVIIGESYIKRHSSLYGYNKNTNPRLTQLQSDGDLNVFTDAISPRNGTSEAFKRFLSMAIDEDTTRKWCDTPLFPTIFKKAGYNVAFYSNQFVKEVEKDSRFNAGSGFFFHPGIEPYIFNERNHNKFEYDEELVKEYLKNRKKIESAPYNLIIFHLLGQHVPYKDRYPPEFSLFSEKDYNERKELSTSQKREVAEYDNATSYNDFVVWQIMKMYQNKDAIVIYFSDHGDECNDFRPHIGRAGDYVEAGRDVARCQFDIPFLIYTPHLFRQNHPYLTKQIQESTNKPFNSDDLPHLLLYLAGIGVSDYLPTRNLIDPSYNTKKKRYIGHEHNAEYNHFVKGNPE